MSVELVAQDRASTRTSERPMAFTFGEFARGALGAWGWFLLFSVPCFAVLPLTMTGNGAITEGDVVTWLSAVFAGFVIIPWGFPLVVFPWSIGALVLGSPLAYLLGLALRRLAPMSAHLAAFSMLGILIGVGASASAAYSVLSGISVTALVPFLLAGAVAVPLGWYRTARRALEDDELTAASADAAPGLPGD